MSWGWNACNWIVRDKCCPSIVWQWLCTIKTSSTGHSYLHFEISTHHDFEIYDCLGLGLSYSVMAIQDDCENSEFKVYGFSCLKHVVKWVYLFSILSSWPFSISWTVYSPQLNGHQILHSHPCFSSAFDNYGYLLCIYEVACSRLLGQTKIM